MDEVRIIVTGHPVAKGRGRAVRLPNGRIMMHTPTKTRRWEEDARMVARQSMGQRKPYTGPVEVHVTASFVIPTAWPKWKLEAAENGLICHTTKPDGDNILKAAKDALNGVVWIDDAQVVMATVVKQYADRPSVKIVVRGKPGLRAQIKTRAEFDAYQERNDSVGHAC